MPVYYRSPLSLLAAIVSGVLLALCFEPWNVSWLVWVWPWPLLCALWYLPKQESPTVWEKIRYGFGLGYLCGFVFFTMSLHWAFHTGKVSGYGSSAWQIVLAGIGAVLGMALYLGCYVGLFGIFANTVGQFHLSLTKKQVSETTFGGELFGPSLTVIKIAFLNGACWVGLEWLRSVAFSGFGWNSLGIALLDHLTLLQFADTIGQIGYGFVIMFCSVVGLATLLRFYREIRYQKIRPHLDFAVAIAIVIFLFLYGFNTISYPPKESVDLDIRINQLNQPIEDKYYGSEQVKAKQMKDYSDFTRLFIDHKTPDIVMWPETALPTVLSYRPTINYFNNRILKGEDFYLFAGIQDYNILNSNIYNSLVVMKGHTDTMQIYNKIHLVPFGEYIPYREKVPLIEKWFGSVIPENFSSGDSYEPLSIEKDGQKIGVIPLICFEDTVGRHARKFVRNGPQFMANVTNDAWFYDSAEPAQHFAAARLRCIELRRPMARCANSGVSGFIDEFGGIFDRESSNQEKLTKRIIQDEETGNTFIRGSRNEILKIDLNQPITFYAKNGDVFSIVLGIIALLGFAVWVFRPRLIN